ncbi:MAG: SRPBCC family protein [Candidatus Limnocylindrales bacterium]
MFNMSESVLIKRSPEDVFEFVADLRNFPIWRANLASSTVVSEKFTDLGARCDEEIQMGPRKIAATCEITAFSAGRTFSFQAVSPGLTYDGHILVIPEEGGSKFTLSGEVRVHGFLRLLQPVIRGRMQEGVRREVAGVKAHMEKSRLG